MRRLLGILVHFLGWQQTMRWTTASGCLRALARGGTLKLDWCVVRPGLWRRPTGARS